MRSDINIKEQELKGYFAGQEDVEFVVLFGSTASGRTNPMSDIDIGVYIKGREDNLKLADKQIEIACGVAEICKTDYVDIVILNRANPFLKFQVIKYGRLIYAKDEKLFYKFKAIVFGLYQDIKPMYDMYDKIAENSLRRGLNG